MTDIGCTSIDSLVDLYNNEFESLPDLKCEDKAKIETALQLLDLGTDADEGTVV